jgi:hypothetical protein
MSMIMRSTSGGDKRASGKEGDLYKNLSIMTAAKIVRMMSRITAIVLT